jgi:hypothetical protein
VPLNGTIAQEADLIAAKTKGALVVFWMGDSAHNVVYSWTFDGRTLGEIGGDLDLGLSTAESVGGTLGQLTRGKDCLFISFNASGALPGPAEVSVRMGDVFADDTTLGLYDYDPGKGVLTEISGGHKVSHGYVDFSISHCSVMVLSPVALVSRARGADRLGGWLVILIVVACVFLVGGGGLAFGLRLWNRRRHACSGDGAGDVGT